MTLVPGARSHVVSHAWNRAANDHYVEPEWCSRRLFDEEQFDGDIWDPCCGFGRIPLAAIAAGYAAAGTDIVDRGYGQAFSCRDFLDFKGSWPNIVCNPPFDIAPRFAAHALTVARRKVAMIFPTARLNAAHWLHDTPLRRVWLMTPRPSMPPGHVIAAGAKAAGGKMDFCWLVWERGYSGAPELRWLRRDVAEA